MIKVNVLYFGAVREACDETPREEVRFRTVPMSGILLINSSKNTLAFAIIVSEYRWRSTNSSRRCRPFSAMVMRSPSSRR